MFPPQGDGAILDALVAAIRREGTSSQLLDSVPLDLWRRAVRMARA